MAGPASLKKIIEDDFKEQKQRMPLKKGGKLRASEFGNMCPRQEVLCAVLNLVREEEFNADSLMIFLHGTALHWAFQNHMLPAIKVLVGKWRCNECGETYGDGNKLPANLVLRPARCTKCDHADFEYRELTLFNKEYDIGGHPDGFLVLPELPGVGILEAKSIMKGWEVKNCPMMAHVIQVQIYMWICGLQWAKIVYWEKGENGTDALIEHHIDRDEDTIKQIQLTIKSIKTGLEGGQLPERVCLKADAPRAKKCNVKGPCFEQPSIPMEGDED